MDLLFKDKSQKLVLFVFVPLFLCLITCGVYAGYDDCLPGSLGAWWGITHGSPRTVDVWAVHMDQTQNCCNHSINDEGAVVDLVYQNTYLHPLNLRLIMYKTAI